MRLSEFILTHIESILQEWEDFARSIQPAPRNMDTTELRDHAEEMLKAIAADLDTPQSELQRDLKAIGKSPRSHADTPAEIHAETRINSGFSLDQLVAEYRALRASVLRLWLGREKPQDWLEMEDINRFNEAIDQCLGESVARYSKSVQQAHDIFVGVMGHDLRTPLQAIGQGAEFLMRTASDASVVQLGSRMFASTSRMGAILDKLVDFTKSRAGGLELAPAFTDLFGLAEQLAEEFRFSHPERTIQLKIAGDTSGYFDQTRMGQVLQNLMSNALQYSPKNSDVTVALSGDEEFISLSVHNFGKPIGMAAQQHIFDPLRRYADQSNEAQVNRNLGLGLFIAKEIVSAHLGTIGVTSCPNNGTIFTVLLPKSLEKSAYKKTAAA
jgi:signal transduction histidine kinase